MCDSLKFSPLLFYMEEKQISYNDMKKLATNAVSKTTKKPTKYSVNVFETNRSFFHITVLSSFGIKVNLKPIKIKCPWFLNHIHSPSDQHWLFT